MGCCSGRYAFTAVLDSLAKRFEEQYEACDVSAAASIGSRLKALTLGAAKVPAVMGLTCNEARVSTEHIKMPLTVDDAMQLLHRICSLHNRLAVQLLQEHDSSRKGLAVSSHLPLLCQLAPALAAAAQRAFQDCGTEATLHEVALQARIFVMASHLEGHLHAGLKLPVFGLEDFCCHVHRNRSLSS